MRVAAAHFGDALALKPLAKDRRPSVHMRTPLILKDGGRYVVLFPYGVAVFWGWTAREEERFIEGLKRYTTNPSEDILRAVDDVRTGEVYDIRNDKITIPGLTLKSVGVVSEVLARSLALEKQELAVDTLIQQFEPLLKSAKRIKRIRVSAKQLLSITSKTMEVRQTTAISLAMLDTPDFVWDESILSDFYKSLLEEFEVTFRYRQLTHKLDLLMQHSKFMLQVLEERRAFWLEITIIALIAVEVVLFVYELAVL